MSFMQTIHFRTDRRDDAVELMGRWSADAMGAGTARRGTLVEDRSARGSYIMAVTFDSAEKAAENSDRPETGAFAEQFAALCDGELEFREFDVVTVYGD